MTRFTTLPDVTGVTIRNGDSIDDVPTKLTTNPPMWINVAQARLIYAVGSTVFVDFGHHEVAFDMPSKDEARAGALELARIAST